jgi:hypothetical protein
MEQLLHSIHALLDFWSRWLNGEHFAEHDHLWGLSMLFWARFGKTTEFVGALSIVFEILGSERLRKLGASLHGLIRLQTMFALWRDSSVVVIAGLKILWRFREKDYKTFEDVPSIVQWTPRRVWLGSIALAVGLLVWVPHVLSLWDVYGWRVLLNPFGLGLTPDSSISNLPRWVVALLREPIALAESLLGSLVICSFVLGPIITSLFTTAAVIGLTLLGALFLEPMARLLARGNLDQLRRIFALLMLLIGFHFDLLTS